MTSALPHGGPELIRPNTKRMLRIGEIAILISVLIFGISIYTLDHSILSENNRYIQPGGTFSMVIYNVSQGDDIEYTVSTLGYPENVTGTLLSPSGYAVEHFSMNGTSQINKVLISNSSGNWTLILKNWGSSAAEINANVGDIGSLVLYLVVIGFILLPFGIVMLGLYAFTRRHQRERERRRGFSN
ncbi:MAG: hypothetical protein QXV22_00610 [Thermoplasmataceae archaeon]